MTDTSELKRHAKPSSLAELVFGKIGVDMTAAPLTPYGSAHDLPSVIEMRSSLAAAKLLTRFVARSQRARFIELEGTLRSISNKVDRFYEVLGPRHWIYTGTLPVDEVSAIVERGEPAERIESAFIEVLGEQIRGPYWRMGLFGHEAMRARSTAIERARQHYLDGQWDSCALALVTVMDGFVNDVEPAQRRGLHAREPGDMVAWDSAVGHHMGLTAVMPIFLRTFKRRHDEEVFEVHRHGMVHGTVTNYNNQIVATKAWNLLHAVNDWAIAMSKLAKPAEAKPTMRDAFAAVAASTASKRYREQFKPWSMTSDQDGFSDLGIVQHASSFLESWRLRRWSIVAESLPYVITQYDTTSGRRATRAKETYDRFALHQFAIDAVSFPMASVAVVSGSATMNEWSGQIEIRWIEQGPTGEITQPPTSDSRWVLAVYPPDTFKRDVA